MARVSRLALVGACWLAAPIPAVAAAEVLPERHQETYCYKPGGTDQVTGHLLFGYAVTPQGRVESVRLVFASVEPEQERGRLVGALTACLQGWTFKPGTRGGRPATFYQLVPFHFFKPAPPDDLEVPIPGGRTLGLSRIQEMYREKMKLAESLLAGREYSEVKGPGWVLRTNVRQKFVESLRQALDRARRVFETVFPSAPPLPADAPLEIVLFRDMYDYGQVEAFDNLVPDSTAGDGVYSPSDHTIYAALGAKPPEIFTELLVHEASHHLVYVRLFGGERVPPLWADEGIACFISGLKAPGAKGLDLVRFERGRVTGGGFIWTRGPESFLQTLKDARRAGRLPPFSDLAAGRLDERHRREEASLFHAMSWLLVHHLVNAEDGRYRSGFERWLLDRSGEPRDLQSLSAALGRPFQEIEAALPAYLEGLK